MLATLTHKPSPIAFRIAKGVIREVKQKRLKPLCIERINRPELRIWVDAAVVDHNGRRGFIVQLADQSWSITDRNNLIHWKSASDKLKHASSTAAEVNAILQALEEVDDLLIIVEALFGPIPSRVLSDSNSGILQIMNGGHTIKSRRKSEYIKEMMELSPIGKMSLEHVEGKLQ